MTKVILGHYGNDRGHWVGDGFPVRSLFSYNSLGQHIRNTNARRRIDLDSLRRGRRDSCPKGTEVETRVDVIGQRCFDLCIARSVIGD